MNFGVELCCGCVRLAGLGLAPNEGFEVGGRDRTYLMRKEFTGRRDDKSGKQSDHNAVVSK